MKLAIEYKFDGKNSVDVVEVNPIEIKGINFLDIRVETVETDYTTANSVMFALNNQLIDDLIEKLQSLKR